MWCFHHSVGRLFLLLCLYPLLAQTQESPYGRIQQEKSPVVLDLADKQLVKPHGLGPWQFGMTPQEAATKSDCDTSSSHTTTPLGRPVENPFIACKVWKRDKSLQSITLLFQGNRLVEFDVAIGFPEDIPQLNLFITEGLSLWRNWNPGPSTLSSRSDFSSLLSTTQSQDILALLQKQAQKEANKEPEVVLQEPDRYPNSKMLFREHAIWFVYAEPPPPRILITGLSIRNDRTGPWFLGMSSAAVLANPACKKSSSPQTMYQEVLCSVRLENIGPSQATLLFHDNQLFRISFPLVQESSVFRSTQRKLLIQRAFHLLQEAAPQEKLYARSLSEKSTFVWESGPITAPWVEHQLSTAPEKLSSIVVYRPNLYPLRIYFFENPSDSSTLPPVLFEFGMISPSKKIPFFTPASFASESLGPFREGMSLQEAQQQPGCEKTNTSGSLLSAKTFLRCEAAFWSLDDPISLQLLFINNRLQQITLFLFQYKLDAPELSQGKIAFALQFFTRIAKGITLQAEVARGNAFVPRSLTITASELMKKLYKAEGEQPQEQTIQLRFIDPKLRNRVLLQLDADKGISLLFSPLSTPAL